MCETFWERGQTSKYYEVLNMIPRIKVPKKPKYIYSYKVLELVIYFLCFMVPPICVEGGEPYAWHTLFGSKTEFFPIGITLDGEDNIYVIANSNGAWNGPAAQPPLHPHSGGGDFVILKTNHNGSYQWHTFYGGGLSKGCRIRSDVNGNVYVAGKSYISWKGPDGQEPLSPFKGNEGKSNIFILKSDSVGTYQWHSFYGVANNDADAQDLAIDNDGNIYVIGSSYGGMLGPEGEYPLFGYSGGFVLKIDTNGIYQWHLFFGMLATAITLEGTSYIYVTGQGMDNWKGPQGQDPIFTIGGQNPGVLKLEKNGVYQWHILYDGWGMGIASDENGNIFVAGQITNDTGWEGPQGQEPLNPYSGAGDMEVMKLNSSGGYLWHTFYGSNGTASFGTSGMVVDSKGNVLVQGWGQTKWNLPGCQKALNDMYGVGLLLKLDNNGNYQWRSQTGGETKAIALDFHDNIFVAVGGFNYFVGPEGQAPLNLPDGYGNIFIEKFSEYTVKTLGDSQTTLASPCTISGTNQPVNFKVSVTDCSGYKRPTGSVTFRVNNITHEEKILDANGEAFFTAHYLPAGNVIISAEYSGDKDYYGSSDEMTQDVRNLSPTNITLTSSNNQPKTGQTVTLTAKVSYCNEAQKPSGTITFILDNKILGSKPVSDDGIATFTVDSISGGPHQIKATYNGDGAFEGSISSISLPVDMAITYLPLILNKHLIRECRKGSGSPPWLYYVRLMPNSVPANSNAQIYVQFSFTDPDGDLNHGDFNYAAPSGHTVSIPLPDALIGIPYGTVGAMVSITTDIQKGNFKIPTWLRDKAGNCSNIIYVDWTQY
jgi:hypothetical protein